MTESSNIEQAGKRIGGVVLFLLGLMFLYGYGPSILHTIIP